ncbi:hypothetical protein [Vibrio sp. vnigr-6D03]|uniref:hypothetical protein n=1 Tax=Vibrio sp. vnigr-6D03 TaxID=2058088 RepID=UPI0011AF7D7D|nr:hypothetical protein [Vibrio sp. vnigr-6D03]
MNFHYKLLHLAICTGLLLSTPANAFKIGTHVWLAAKVAEDVVEDNKVSIYFDESGQTDTLTVDPIVVRSIKRFPKAFLFGVLGADIYPDLVAGQMTTHPGLPFQPLNRCGEKINVDSKGQLQPDNRYCHPKDIDLGSPDNYGVSPLILPVMKAANLYLSGHSWGWQTDDWLRHVRDAALQTSGNRGSSEVAFAYGYLLHAAMDTWAHSYVNVYTGDLFSLSKNQTVPARHTALEGYINSLHDSYDDDPLSILRISTKSHTQARAQAQDSYQSLKAPTEFVRRTLILNDTTAWQYGRESGAVHIWAMWASWKISKQLNQRFEPIQTELRRVLNEQIQKVSDAEQLWQAAEDAKNIAIQGASDAYETLKEHEESLVAATQNLEDATNNVIEHIESNIALKNAFSTADRVIERVLSLLPSWIQQQYRTAKNRLSRVRLDLDFARNHYNNQLMIRERRLTALAEALTKMNLEKSVLSALSTMRDVGLTAIERSLSGWTRNIEASVDAYIHAYEETGRELLRPHGNRFEEQKSAVQALKNWVICWAPIFSSPVPNSQMLSRSCQVGIESYTDFNETVRQFKLNTLIQDRRLRDAIIEFDEANAEIKVSVLPQIGRLIRQAIPFTDQSVAAPGSAEFLARLWDHHVTKKDLVDLYASDSSEQNLLTFRAQGQEIIAMLQADGLDIEKYEKHHKTLKLDDMMRFTPIRNAMQLSKLALVNNNELNDWVSEKGVTSSPYPDSNPLYRANGSAGDILIGALRSIDGNHQWLAVAPPLPRKPKIGNELRGTEEACRRFGYPIHSQYIPTKPLKPERIRTHSEFNRDCQNTALFRYRANNTEYTPGGFRLWQSRLAREKVFSKIFKGPLSLGMCHHLKDKRSEPESYQPSYYTTYIGLGCVGNNYVDTNLLSILHMHQNNIRHSQPTLRAIQGN